MSIRTEIGIDSLSLVRMSAANYCYSFRRPVGKIKKLIAQRVVGGKRSKGRTPRRWIDPATESTWLPLRQIVREAKDKEAAGDDGPVFQEVECSRVDSVMINTKEEREVR